MVCYYKLRKLGINMSTIIITDSTSYINPKLTSKYDVRIASLYVNFKHEEFKETDIKNEKFYSKMEKEGIPTSSQPPVGMIYSMMEEELRKGNDIIGVFLSSKFSGTYQSVQMVAAELLEKYPDRKVAILDSRSNSMQLGFAALTAAKLARNNVDFEEIVKATENNIERSRFLFIPETLKYLEKGGRIGKAGALLGSVLKITPILTVEKGMTEVYKNVRTKKRALDTMIAKMMEDHQAYNVQEIAIHHIDREDEAIALKERIQELINVNVFISSIGPVIGLHVGPGAIGIVYYTA